MNTISAQEIKRRGISALDKSLKLGPVHIIKKNLPQYVVMTEACYEELIESEKEAHITRIRTALEDVESGRTMHYNSAKELLADIEKDL